MTALATRWSLAVILIGFSLVTACRSSYPVPILLPYGTTISYLGYPYPGAPYHEGVDIAGQVGDPILGLLGATGNAGPTPHIHWEIRTQDGSTEDPLAVTDGCFNPSKAYPADQFILTLPVKC